MEKKKKKISENIYVGLIIDLFITDQQILRELERKKILVFTPSRRVAGKRVVCYDDRFIVKLAYDVDGIIVSNDTYRDLQGEKPEWKRFIEERLLMYSFVNDKYVTPQSLLGRVHEYKLPTQLTSLINISNISFPFLSRRINTFVFFCF